MIGTIENIENLIGELSEQADSIVGEVNIPLTIREKTYPGDYTITPKAWSSTTLHTKGFSMNDDITISEVPYFETSNETGDTVYIANEV